MGHEKTMLGKDATYQELAVSYAQFPLDFRGLAYTTLALSEEIGEFNSIFARVVRQGRNFTEITVEEHARATKELGDIMWNVAATAYILGYSLEELQEQNISKVQDRAQRGVIEGRGDDR